MNNKQTVYILCFKTNLNIDVFQIVFSVFSLIRVIAYSQAWAISESSDVGAVCACWVFWGSKLLSGPGVGNCWLEAMGVRVQM